MILKRKRYRFPISKGYYAFLTKKSDLLEYAADFRLEHEIGRYDSIAHVIHPEYTMVNAQPAYMPCAKYWYTKQAILDSNNAKWCSRFGFYDDIDVITSKNVVKSNKIFLYYKDNKELFNNQYILVYWETNRMSRADIIEHLQSLVIECANKKSIPLYYIALCVYKEGKYGRELWRLFIKKSFLRTFTVGIMLINLYEKMKVNFKKVYGFEPENLW